MRGTLVVVAVVVVVAVSVVVWLGPAPRREPNDEQIDAEPKGDETGEKTEPWIQVLWTERLLQRQHQKTKGQDGGRVHRRHGRTDGDRLARVGVRTDHVGRHQGLAVAGKERVPGAEQDREQQRQDHQGKSMIADETGEGPSLDQGTPGSDRSLAPGGGHDFAGLEGASRRGHVQRTGEQILGIGKERVADALRRHVRAAQADAFLPDRGDLAPPDVAGVVRIGEAERAARRIG
jgi:hypothetical protein